ncbi:glycosyltransferase family 2 protein [Butyrivibrio sp. TB]|uniref:glycosyltransferase family 2 protein n=1 Tax=Butyrivibrio sp. TB TaxID=1520809 RepID=UPI0008B3DAD9|nr:glycosyltransferase family 2 protein [Butyrivibrio sp. TB]SEQ15120.1 Glycosyl transferase family 2 [Butyrivibrio sp. TB]
MNRPIKFSIITVTFNCADTIERTILSVLSQHNVTCEYVIIDGASSDGTKRIIEQYQYEIDYYLSEPDEGIYDAMNKAIKHTTGDVVLFLNGDDYFSTNHSLEDISKWIIGDNSIVIGRVQYGDKLSVCYSDKSIKSPYFEIFYPHQATFVPRSLYDSLGGFDENYKISADFDWICRATYKGIKIKWVDELVSVYKLGGRSASLQCKIDEYNISRKYMELTEDSYIDEMKKDTEDKVRNYFFKEMCLNKEYHHKCKQVLNEVFHEEQTVQIWGAGMWGQILTDLLVGCGINVNHIFDAKAHDTICGVEVCEFEQSKANMIVVASEVYDEEISRQLEVIGYENARNYIRFRTLRDELLKVFNVKCEEYADFVTQTGLEVFSR